ncbi:tryptophan halogenase family protein [Salinimonas sediminis]|uniref:Tryptophan 7-halogenase n=1 Tax=Salinimonas sediminis TaxID=2303538 RepID=A0A346NRG0_9ALTE|nr:tryptophan halogenase family protein [Salinimonas sediminis]AXR08117.1 tryptophan 7-halogenase [Salinimonas sediminis]
MQQTNTPLHSVVIMGGGAAGWLTAGIMAAASTARRPLHITVVESPDVGILGVGEGTWPTMRDTLRKMGIDEATLLRECDASFKQGTCFRQWYNGQSDDVYFHPFDLPAGMFETDILGWWANGQQHVPYAQLFSATPQLCKANKAPKQAQTPPYAAVANYGYHLDANKFAALLKRHCMHHLGVKHVELHVSKVEADDHGYLTALGDGQVQVTGDFFVDCSGFAASLIGQHFGVKLQDQSAILHNNSALAVQATYRQDTPPIACTTHSTAHPNGWIWDIALPHRKGVGCVYSSAFCDEDYARKTLLDYLNRDTAIEPVSEHQVRKLSFTPGYRETPWVKNCVAIGAAAGFLEPLEASALVMTELAANHVAAQLPYTREHCAPAARQFNTAMQNKWSRIIDFLKLHYVLSTRDDSLYWRSMKNPSGASVQLNDWLAMWHHRSPNIHDFQFQDELFPLASYLYILSGMGYAPVGASPHQIGTKAEQFVRQNYQRSRQLLAALPDNRILIEQIRQG